MVGIHVRHARLRHVVPDETDDLKPGQDRKFTREDILRMLVVQHGADTNVRFTDGTKLFNYVDRKEIKNWLETRLQDGNVPNKLQALPEGFAKLTALRALDLKGNQFSSIPEQLQGVTSLREFSIDSNPCSDQKQALPAWFSRQSMPGLGSRLRNRYIWE